MKTYLEDQFDVCESGNENIRLLNCQCPYCNHTGKVYVKVSIKQVYCFHCSQSYNMYSYFADYEGITPAEFWRELKGEHISKYETDKPFIKEPVSKPERLFFPEMTELPPKAVKYLSDRGISTELINSFKIKYSPCNSSYNNKIVYTGNRIIFPLFNRERKLESWQGRDITGASSVKYLFSPDYKPSHNLYNIWGITNAPDYLILTEGVFDVFGWYKRGFKNAVASFGKKLSDMQASLLFKIKPKILLLAWDYNCYTEMFECAAKLNHIIPDIRIVELPQNKDADECDKLELIKIFSQATKPSWSKKILNKL